MNGGRGGGPNKHLGGWKKDQKLTSVGGRLFGTQEQLLTLNIFHTFFWCFHIRLLTSKCWLRIFDKCKERDNSASYDRNVITVH